MSGNIQSPAPGDVPLVNLYNIKKSSARICSVISFYKNAYTALAVTTSGFLLHVGLFNISDGAVVFICILLLIGLGVGLIGMVTTGFRIDKINRLTRSILEAASRREDKAVLLLLEGLEDYKSTPCSAFWRTEPFVLKEVSL